MAFGKESFKVGDNVMFKEEEKERSVKEGPLGEGNHLGVNGILRFDGGFINEDIGKCLILDGPSVDSLFILKKLLKSGIFVMVADGGRD